MRIEITASGERIVVDTRVFRCVLVHNHNGEVYHRFFLTPGIVFELCAVTEEARNSLFKAIDRIFELVGQGEYCHIRSRGGLCIAGKDRTTLLHFPGEFALVFKDANCYVGREMAEYYREVERNANSKN